MRKPASFVLSVAGLLLLPACSPRDFLTRRLAADLIQNSATFRAPEGLGFAMGIVSNQDYVSAKYVALQHRGWISAAAAKCPVELERPCWNITLTPAGVETLQNLIPAADRDKQSFQIPAARRELVEITGIAKQGHAADVEFSWRWVPLNEFGAAFYSGDVQRSTVLFRSFDDGWRVVETAEGGLPLRDALKKENSTRTQP